MVGMEQRRKNNQINISLISINGSLLTFCEEQLLLILKYTPSCTKSLLMHFEKTLQEYFTTQGESCMENGWKSVGSRRFCFSKLSP